MEIYRINSVIENSHGPWRDPENSITLMDRLYKLREMQGWHADWGYYPEPRNDKGILRNPHKFEVCGFQTLELFKAWFPYKAERLLIQESLDYGLFIYDVPDGMVHFGKTQCLFPVRNSIRVREATSIEYDTLLHSPEHYEVPDYILNARVNYL